MLGWLFSFILRLFNMPFTINGIEMSFWQIFVFTFVVGIASSVISRILSGDS